MRRTAFLQCQQGRTALCLVPEPSAAAAGKRTIRSRTSWRPWLKNGPQPGRSSWACCMSTCWRRRRRRASTPPGPRSWSGCWPRWARGAQRRYWPAGRRAPSAWCWGRTSRRSSARCAGGSSASSPAARTTRPAPRQSGRWRSAASSAAACTTTPWSCWSSSSTCCRARARGSPSWTSRCPRRWRPGGCWPPPRARSTCRRRAARWWSRCAWSSCRAAAPAWRRAWPPPRSSPSCTKPCTQRRRSRTRRTGARSRRGGAPWRPASWWRRCRRRTRSWRSSGRRRSASWVGCRRRAPSACRSGTERSSARSCGT
mmetsp:Transcript_14104/g.25288  ORF Transcript_14104/g.25288 Transcript_14104/m.25288 type:complete len:313 (-) Transcript_14104:567-1505(-)